MATLTLDTDGSGRKLIRGEITHKTINSVLNQNIFDSNPLTVDFSGVTHADSSGLALMVQWTRRAQKEAVTLHFVHIPEKLFALAKMSNVDTILPINR